MSDSGGALLYRKALRLRRLGDRQERTLRHMRCRRHLLPSFPSLTDPISAGAGQDMIGVSGQKDASGNPVLNEIGDLLREQLNTYFEVGRPSMPFTPTLGSALLA